MRALHTQAIAFENLSPFLGAALNVDVAALHAATRRLLRACAGTFAKMW